MGADICPVVVIEQGIMVMIHAHFSSAFTPFVGERDVDIDDGIKTLGELFELLVDRYPAWGEEVTQDGQIPDFNLLIAVNGVLSSTLSGLDTPLHSGDRVEFHLLLTGG